MPHGCNLVIFEHIPWTPEVYPHATYRRPSPWDIVYRCADATRYQGLAAEQDDSTCTKLRGKSWTNF
jgi:hypothetical protein